MKKHRPIYFEADEGKRVVIGMVEIEVLYNVIKPIESTEVIIHKIHINSKDGAHVSLRGEGK